ncbi:MAG: sugar transferase [Cyanobacteria bacterium P01_A01_bin.84]
MDSKPLALVTLKPDLRSAKRGARIQKGLSIRLFRIFTLLSLDILSLYLAWRVSLFYGTPIESAWINKDYFLVVTLSVELGLIASRGLYKAGANRRDYTGLIKSVSLSGLILLLVGFLYEPQGYVSRSTFLLFWICSLAFVCAGRFLFESLTNIVRQKGVVRHSVFLITELENQESHIALVEKENYYKILGVNDPSCLDLSHREETFDYLRKLGITETFVSWEAICKRFYVCWGFHTAGITLNILPTVSAFNHPKSKIQIVGDMPCLTLPLPMIIGVDFWVKRCFDLFLSIILLFILSPVYLLISLLIKIDSPGPIFFKQNRIGLHRKKFQVWKFRTMVVNAEKLQASLETKNQIKDGVLFKMKDDPRITKIGKFLRLYSLDELPQIFNVLFGEMSLVGPRPLPLRDVDRFKPSHFIRQEVLPGITGLWQVSGRSNIESFEDAIKLDMDYIENWSLWLDMRILLKTVSVVLQKTGAY